MRRALARMAMAVVGVVLAGITAVGLLLFTMWWQHTAPVALPVPTGPYAVGRTLFWWTNPTSGEELAVWLWYPAEGGQGSPASYLPTAWRHALREHQATFMRSFFNRDPIVVRAHSRSDPPIAWQRRTYPVVLLRPGGSALTADFTTLAEDLASHGYAVVGFDAPRRSFVFVGSDGRAIGRAPGNSVENANGNLADPLVSRLLATWVSDAKAVIDRMQQLDAASSGTFAGRLDLRRLGAVGHSFGGATALQFCHEDSRCRAAIDLDGIPFGSVVADGLAKPAMFLLSDHSREMSDPESHKVLAMIDSIFARLPQPRLYATIRNANHFTFSDQSLLNSPAAMALFRLAGFGKVGARRGLAISDDFVCTFFDVTLNGAPASMLDHLAVRHEEVVDARF
jgi:predicted dienelactone hydrolase